jgi:para-aminobenzoate synthetase component I
MMNIEKFRQQMNRLGQAKVPFLFVVDFEMENPMLLTLNEIDSTNILYNVNGFTNAENKTVDPERLMMEKIPVPLTEYQRKFDHVFTHLEYGDSFLTNLTVKTEINVNLSLRDIFFLSQAKYKLLLEGQFLVFSPEIFVQIREGKIFCYPMKGTIDASKPDAAAQIMGDKKEVSEHVTIVDLIRNDLSQVSSAVSVTRFRYVDEIRTDSKTLLQVSSEIVGELGGTYFSHLGDILVKLLPAGSVSGAPKPKTLEIIRNVEGGNRGYYTGVFGVFDGNTLDSGVMIRFIEQENGKLYYRSGGGITTQSVVSSEYQEVIDKVYVPLT